MSNRRTSLFCRRGSWQPSRAELDVVALNTGDIVQQRKDLRYHKDVIVMLKHWWFVCDLDGNGMIDHDEYVALSCKIYRALEEDYDEQARRQSHCPAAPQRCALCVVCVRCAGGTRMRRARLGGG